MDEETKESEAQFSEELLSDALLEDDLELASDLDKIPV